MQTLFPEVHPPRPRRDRGGAVRRRGAGTKHRPGARLRHPAAAGPIVQVGQRVRVPLGEAEPPGARLRRFDPADRPTTRSIKPLLEIDDERVLVDAEADGAGAVDEPLLLSTPLGTVLETIIPSAVKKKVGHRVRADGSAAAEREELQAMLEKTKAPKRRAMLARLLQLEPGGVDRAGPPGRRGGRDAADGAQAGAAGADHDHAGDGPAAARPPTPSSPARRRAGASTLNEDQQKVFDELRPARRRRGGFSVNLLLGVTGSGKTEIYLQCIREVVERGQAGDRAGAGDRADAADGPAVHRAVQARRDPAQRPDRHRAAPVLADDRAAARRDVVVGARSAVFAPVPNLGMIVVDEEHESSYKQDTAPRYHARDVAIKRAQLEGVPVLLGSATPSLETYRSG